MEVQQKRISATGIRFSLVDAGRQEVARAYLYILSNDLHKQPFGLLEDVFVEASTRLKMFKDLGIMVGTVAKLKFNPIEVVSDLRSRSSDIVMIDFGEDLGSPGELDVNPLKIMNDAFESLKRWEPSLTVEEERSFESGFHQGLCHYTS